MQIPDHRASIQMHCRLSLLTIVDEHKPSPSTRRRWAAHRGWRLISTNWHSFGSRRMSTQVLSALQGIFSFSTPGTRAAITGQPNALMYQFDLVTS